MKDIIKGIFYQLTVVRPMLTFHVVNGYHDLHPEVS